MIIHLYVVVDVVRTPATFGMCKLMRTKHIGNERVDEGNKIEQEIGMVSCILYHATIKINLWQNWIMAIYLQISIKNVHRLYM